MAVAGETSRARVYNASAERGATTNSCRQRDRVLSVLSVMTATGAEISQDLDVRRPGGQFDRAPDSRTLSRLRRASRFVASCLEWVFGVLVLIVALLWRKPTHQPLI